MVVVVGGNWELIEELLEIEAHCSNSLHVIKVYVTSPIAREIPTITVWLFASLTDRKLLPVRAKLWSRCICVEDQCQERWRTLDTEWPESVDQQCRTCWTVHSHG